MDRSQWEDCQRLLERLLRALEMRCQQRGWRMPGIAAGVITPVEPAAEKHCRAPVDTRPLVWRLPAVEEKIAKGD
ncbi:MAG: hypothetical protein ACOX2J_01355 [Bacillota bacterium]